MDKISPTARALRCLLALQESPGITAEQLAAQLDVSPRAVRRYIAILREADIPVESVPGLHGGYRLGRGVRPPPLTFTVTEVVALAMAALDASPAAASADPVGSALDKLLRSLPPAIAGSAATLRRTTAAAPDQDRARPDPTTTMELVHACTDRRAVRCSYRSESGTDSDVDVDPWAVVVRRGRWYLLCRSRSHHQVRTYRIDRIRAVTQLNTTATSAPSDLDAVAVLEQHLATGWKHDVEVIIHAPLEAVAWLPRTLGRIEALDATTTRLTGSTSNPYWFAEQLALLPAPFHVVRGPELRRTVAELGARLLTAANPDVGLADNPCSTWPQPV